MRPHTMGRLSLFIWREDTTINRECCAYARTLAPVAGVSGGDRWLHPTVLCGMQSESSYFNTGSSHWRRRHHRRRRMLSRCGASGYGGVAATDIELSCVIRNILHAGCWIPDTKGIDLFRGFHIAPLGWPALHRPEHFCSGWCIVECLTGALWDGWD